MIAEPSHLSSPTSWNWRALFLGCAFAVVLAVFCEIGARLDDWFFEGTSLFENPSYDALFITDENGIRRGRPGAHWKKVRMNELGMRGPAVSAVPRSGCARWMFLGASETFGEPAVLDEEFPARVHKSLSVRTCVDLLNAAYPGIAPQDLQRYFQSALSKHAPEVVFVYPSTHFYLAGGPAQQRPSAPVSAPAAAPKPEASPRLSLAGILKQSRFFERLRDSAEIPAPIQKFRVKRWIAAAANDAPFKELPLDRLTALENDLTELLSSIRQSGAEPVLMTHAVRVTTPPRPDDIQDLFAMRVYVPRASEELLAEFEYAAAERTRQVAQRMRVRLIDIAGEMSGRREYFTDLVHFSSKGNERVAELIVEEMRLPASTKP